MNPKNVYFHLRKDRNVSFALEKKDLDLDGPITWSDNSVKLRSFWNNKPKSPTTLHISTSLPIIHQSIIPRIRQFYSIPLLKSTLQKCVRRREVRKAIRMAYNLLCHSPNELLRRIAVITIEDAVLHPNYDQMVWFMIAITKSYTLSYTDVHHIMSFISNIASCQKKDVSHAIWMEPEKSWKNPILTYRKVFDSKIEDRKLRQKCISLISSIIFRANYGGMKGDIKMLKSFSFLWTKRFLMKKKGGAATNSISPPIYWMNEVIKKKCYPNTHLIPNILPNLVKSPVPPGGGHNQSINSTVFQLPELPLNSSEDRPTFGIDQHIYPHLVKQVIQFFPDLNEKSEGRIGQAIWFHSSGVSFKSLLVSAKKRLVVLDSDNTMRVDEDMAQSIESSKKMWNKIKSYWSQLVHKPYFWNKNEQNNPDFKKRARNERMKDATSKQGKEKKQKVDHKRITDFFKKK